MIVDPDQLGRQNLFRNPEICSSEISKAGGGGGWGGAGPHLVLCLVSLLTLPWPGRMTDQVSTKLSIHVETSKKFFRQGANHRGRESVGERGEKCQAEVGRKINIKLLRVSQGLCCIITSSHQTQTELTHGAPCETLIALLRSNVQHFQRE